MFPTKVLRFGGCLAALGWFLMLPSICAVAFAGFIAVTGTAATATTSSESLNKANAEAFSQLEKIDGLPSHVLADFKRDHRVATSTLASLPPEQRVEVEGILDHRAAAIAGGALGAGLFATMGTAFVLAIFGASVPVFIVGLLIAGKKKVLQCRECDAVIARA